MIGLILCTDLIGTIGKDNKLVYELPKDLNRFKEITTGSVVVMGSKTWESLPRKLPNRVNIVLSNNFLSSKEPDLVISSIYEIFKLEEITDVFVIGGSTLYREMLYKVDVVYHTLVCDIVDGDVRFPQIFNIGEEFELVETEKETDIDRISGKEFDIIFRTFKRKEYEL